MSVTLKDQRKGNEYSFKGLSTDDKPTEGVGVNSLFWELDTNDNYYFDGEAWQEVGSSVSATAHKIYFEFSDGTNTTIDVYYDDPLIGTMITSYEPVTYDNKTVTLAQLDGVTWYEPANIPLNTELTDLSKVTGDVSIGNDGSIVATQYTGVSDYTPISANMSFTYIGMRWYAFAFYDENKTLISAFNMYNETTESQYDSNIGIGTLSGNQIPSNAAYCKITTYASPSDHNVLSLIRTA